MGSESASPEFQRAAGEVYRAEKSVASVEMGRKGSVANGRKPSGQQVSKRHKSRCWSGTVGGLAFDYVASDVLALLPEAQRLFKKKAGQVADDDAVAGTHGQGAAVVIVLTIAHQIELLITLQRVDSVKGKLGEMTQSVGEEVGAIGRKTAGPHRLHRALKNFKWIGYAGAAGSNEDVHRGGVLRFQGKGVDEIGIIRPARLHHAVLEEWE